MKKPIKYTLIIILFFAALPIFPQSGMKYSEFAKKLETYFHPDLIDDITQSLTRTDFTVWSWDVGDFSDDGHNDVAFAIRRLGNKDRNMDVYMFADIDGYLVNVGQFKYEFVELPLEVGVAFRYGVLYVTQKFKQFNWKIDGFKLTGGSLLYYDRYNTSRIGKYTHETYTNYYALRNTEKYLQTANSKTDFWTDYYSITSYRRNRFIYKGITDDTFVNDIAFCPEGAYWWQGDSDLSYYVSSAYDDDFLYFTVLVVDDKVVQPYNNIENGEQIELYINPTNYDLEADRFAEVKDDNVKFLNIANGNDTNIYKIQIFVGDFIHKEPTMSITNGIGIKYMNENVITDLTDNGYYAIFKIPFTAFKHKTLPLQGDEFMQWAATVRVIDVDNEFKPKQRTVLQTSNYMDENSATLGNIIFIPDEKWYGEATNIYMDKIVSLLESIGF
ncbi:MAG: hypothetical protein LBO69_01945 [Ignavibacteria bacterium]|jgi:hypothetical protein|nr:hypothetical protein [Ignavibacteria bacterium]